MISMPHTSYHAKEGAYVIEYNFYPENILEVVYYNRNTGYRRVHRVYFEGFVTTKLVEEALKVSKNLLLRVKSRIAKPNIPLYAIIYILMKYLPGFGYKCKVKKYLCPLKVYRVENGREYSLSIGSIVEQTYRVVRKYQ